MSRQKYEKTFNTFTKGLMTEASELNFPEDFSLYEKNFLLHRDGGRDRRRGMELLYPLGLTLTSKIYPQESRDTVSSFVEFPMGHLRLSVRSFDYAGDSSEASISFPEAVLRQPLQMYSSRDGVGTDVSFPEASLRAPLTMYDLRDSVATSVTLPEAILRNGLIKINHNSDSVETEIIFPEAVLHAPN